MRTKACLLPLFFAFIFLFSLLFALDQQTAGAAELEEPAPPKASTGGRFTFAASNPISASVVLSIKRLGIEYAHPILAGQITVFTATASADLYADGFENGSGDWSMTGSWRLVSENDACGSPAEPFPGLVGAAYAGSDAECDPGADLTVNGKLSLLELVSLPPDGSAIFSFWSYEQSEHQRYVELSADGGYRWSRVAELGAENSWHKTALDLSPYRGQDVFIRFVFDANRDTSSDDSTSGDGGSTGDGPGWLIDDVSLTTVLDGEDIVYEWSFGEGITSTGRVTEHVYPAAGTYEVTVTAVGQSNTLTATTTVSVEDESVESPPPIKSPSPPVEEVPAAAEPETIAPTPTAPTSIDDVDLLANGGVTITVCHNGGCDYANLEEAVSLAPSGAEILIATGVYTNPDISAEGRILTIDKELTLSGGYTTTNWTTPDPDANPTILDAQDLGQVIYADTAFTTLTLQGLTMQRGTSPAVEVSNARLVLENSQVISGTGSYVLHLTDSDNALIRDNLFAGNAGRIYVTSSEYVLVEDNTVTGGSYGLQLNAANHYATIRNNTFSNGTN
ncbi:MAG TPA: right-handed parallel beta-helix repeat-containing protein, partial [Anaerolineae bacterium]|nr:right-handed parallel beta-helix repeat-containing protein [Anaerolineae bacterium]